jgi:hypothetical protein
VLKEGQLGQEGTTTLDINQEEDKPVVVVVMGVGSDQLEVDWLTINKIRVNTYDFK